MRSDWHVASKFIAPSDLMVDLEKDKGTSRYPFNGMVQAYSFGDGKLSETKGSLVRVQPMLTAPVSTQAAVPIQSYRLISAVTQQLIELNPDLKGVHVYFGMIARIKHTITYAQTLGFLPWR